MVAPVCNERPAPLREAIAVKGMTAVLDCGHVTHRNNLITGPKKRPVFACDACALDADHTIAQWGIEERDLL